MNLLIINGPNLNMLGIREPEIYGRQDYSMLCTFIKAAAEEVGATCEIFQSNHEGAIVDKIQGALGRFDGIVINPAAYTHTSVAIADALSAVALPTVEVHLSDITQRETFRQHSFVAPIAKKTFMGKGFEGYRLAIRFLADNS
ncbi:MAG: type II 3-dehydroquinate dehydratase [Clostridia bacterium]|nr:type II 3-dehydroquinate dehydratase [Clostridia bacterium]